jgi:uncharacterized protein
VQFEEGDVCGFLHRPTDNSEQGLVLTHGAGSNCNSALLTATATAFSAAGLWVLRCDLPFRQRRASGPPSPSTAADDRTGLKDAVTAMRRFASGRVFLGGHSYGGRQASILAADEPTLVQGLLLLSYPLHPPAKPGQRRTVHFPRLSVPTMFVHGTADPFGSVKELQAAVALIPAPTKIIPILGARHDLKSGRFDPLAAVTAFLDLVASYIAAATSSLRPGPGRTRDAQRG